MLSIGPHIGFFTWNGNMIVSYASTKYGSFIISLFQKNLDPAVLLPVYLYQYSYIDHKHTTEKVMCVYPLSRENIGLFSFVQLAICSFTTGLSIVWKYATRSSDKQMDRQQYRIVKGRFFAAIRTYRENFLKMSNWRVSSSHCLSTALLISSHQ